MIDPQVVASVVQIREKFDNYTPGEDSEDKIKVVLPRFAYQFREQFGGSNLMKLNYLCYYRELKVEINLIT